MPNLEKIVSDARENIRDLQEYDILDFQLYSALNYMYRSYSNGFITKSEGVDFRRRVEVLYKNNKKAYDFEKKMYWGNIKNIKESESRRIQLNKYMADSEHDKALKEALEIIKLLTAEYEYKG